jgi:phosphohistidine swiveling domain-containing protein
VLPSLVAEGLAVNDRIKVRMSALQAAAQHAQQPDRPATDLSVESRAAGISSTELAILISGAHLAGDGRVDAPDLARLIKDIHDDAEAMIHAVGTGKPTDGEAAKARLAAIEAAGLLAPASQIDIARITRLTGVTQEGSDSLHRLVMDLTRAAKRTPRAALRIAVDLVHEGLIGQEEALMRLADLDHGSLAETSLVSAGKPVVTGIGASAGIAVGRAAFDSESAERLAATGDAVILMRPDTSTADVAGFAVAAGIVTSVGARTAHAALVACQMGKPCIVGCTDMKIDAAAGQAQLEDTTILSGDWITIEGSNGSLYLGQPETTVSRPEAELAEVARWRSELRERDHRKPQIPLPPSIHGSSVLG